MWGVGWAAAAPWALGGPPPLAPLARPLSPQDEDAQVAKLVAQRLGTWQPPPLSARERAALEDERAALRARLRVLAEAVRAERAAGDAGR